MARPLRCEYAGAVYHLTSRGNARQPIYATDDDRQGFLRLLAQAIERFHWTCYAYCLMNNHYHLVVETRLPTLSQGMRHLNGVYTQRFNRVHRRVGHVFQGRYQAIVVERDAHLLELCRYVVLNPVRAGLVQDPATWPWSSYRATIGLDPAPAWLAVDQVLAHWAGTRRVAQARYHTFVLDGLRAPSPWRRLQGQIYLGSEAFCQRFLVDEPLPEVPRQQLQPIRPSLSGLFIESGDREQKALEAYRRYGYRMREIAEYVGVHYATISRWIHIGEGQARARLNKHADQMLECKT